MNCSALKRQLTDAASRLSSPFCCGGSFQLRPSTSSIRLAFKDGNGPGLSCMELPTMNGGRMIEKLVAACTEAPFGRGTETVYDSTFRKSLKLDLDDFLTSFELSNSTILQSVKQVLAPRAKLITAELYKLNVYRPGDFFLPHVDTPRVGSFASLVVLLPMAFTGGELVVEHKEDSNCFDWSQGAADDSSRDGTIMINWAAFYSNCKHEVKEVTSGFRIVLTYNLYQNGDENGKDERHTQMESWIKKSELYRVLQHARENYRGESVTLGFPCSHVYPVLLHGHNRRSHIAEMLKGEDLLLYEAAKSAGLRPQLCRIWKPDEHMLQDEEGTVVYFVDMGFDGICISNRCWYFEEESAKTALDFLGDGDCDIQWCTNADFQDFDWQENGACGSYGNEASTETLYCIVAILIDFTEQGAKRRKMMDQKEAQDS